MRTTHPDPRPTRPRACRALPHGWLAAPAWALAPLLLASCTDSVTANCPPLGHPPILTVAAAGNPCAAKAGESAELLAQRLVSVGQEPSARLPITRYRALAGAAAGRAA